MPLIAVEEPNRLGRLLGTGPQHQVELLSCPASELAAQAFDPAARCRGGGLRRIGTRSVIIHVAAEFHFRSPSALEPAGEVGFLQEHLSEMGLGYPTCK